MNELLQGSTEALNFVSTAILVTVILLMAVSFSVLFYFYAKNRSKCIENKLEDGEIRKNLIAEEKTYFANAQQVIENAGFSATQKMQEIPKLSAFLAEKKRKQKPFKVFFKCLSVLLYGVLIMLLGFAFMLNLKTGLVYVGNKASLVVVTSSMQYVNSYNTYITTHNLTNQIAVNTLIQLKKPVQQDDVKLYDIIAYKDDANNIIVHRVIKIEPVAGNLLYTCRGDANAVSADFEKNMNFDEILGVYTGHSSFALGVLITYMRSSIGIITLCFALIVLWVYDAFDKKLQKKVAVRKEQLVKEIEAEIENAVLKGTNINFAPHKKQNVQQQKPEIIAISEQNDVVEAQNKVATPAKTKVEVKTKTVPQQQTKVAKSKATATTKTTAAAKSKALEKTNATLKPKAVAKDKAVPVPSEVKKPVKPKLPVAKAQTSAKTKTATKATAKPTTAKAKEAKPKTSKKIDNASA